MNNKSNIQIALYDDNADLRRNLARLLAAIPDFDFIDAYGHANLIIENCQLRKPDVIIMDIDMPGMSGIEAVKLVSKHFPEIKVLMLTVFDEDEKIFKAICNGACGYLLKRTDPAEMIQAIKEAYEGGAPMSPSIAIKVLHMFRKQQAVPADETNLSVRELEVLHFLAKGLSYKMIATECHISIDTVRFYIKKIYEKLHVHSMTEAVSKAIRNKLV
ncbi:MAG: response regulator transcription factor [Saprospiraceae bacterium]